MNVFILEQNMRLTQLAEYRYLLTVSFSFTRERLAKIVIQGSFSERQELADKCALLLKTLAEIDAAFAEYFASDGGLN